MRKVVCIIPVVIIAIAIAVSLQPKNETNIAYHVTLADPKLYNMGPLQIISKFKREYINSVLYQMVTALKIFQFH
jgi:hypothetical protein